MGLIYIPKYVRQDSDLNYGEAVTHENYNEKLNLNTTQGDYNTYVLDLLLNNPNEDETFHISYIDNLIHNKDAAVTQLQQDVIDLANTDKTIQARIDTTNSNINSIVDGATMVGRANTAETIASGATAGPNKYYGTDKDSKLGFIQLPEFIYADEIMTTTDVEGVYFLPSPNSIVESMLAEDVRLKLNREAITDYDYLTNRPKINGVTLEGNKAIGDLGLQAAGDYVTNSELNTELSSYYKITDAQSWVNTILNNYATTESLNTTNNNVTTAQNTATNAYNRAYTCARVGINEAPRSPQNGDLIVYV